MAKAFASQGDMSEKNISFTEIGDGLWAFTAWMAGPVNALFLLYDQANPLSGPGATYPIAMISLGATVGWLAALFATQRYITRLNAN